MREGGRRQETGRRLSPSSHLCLCLQGIDHFDASLVALQQRHQRGRCAAAATAEDDGRHLPAGLLVHDHRLRRGCSCTSSAQAVREQQQQRKQTTLAACECVCVRVCGRSSAAAAGAASRESDCHVFIDFSLLFAHRLAPPCLLARSLATAAAAAPSSPTLGGRNR